MHANYTERKVQRGKRGREGEREREREREREKGKTEWPYMHVPRENPGSTCTHVQGTHFTTCLQQGQQMLATTNKKQST